MSLENHTYFHFRIGRHAPIATDCNNVILTNAEKEAMKIIFTYQKSTLMERVADVKCDQVKLCCAKKFQKLNCNVQRIYEDTKLHYLAWEEERQCRITGSTCYGLFTYTNSRNPDWQKKCSSHLKPVKFKSKYTDYGRKAEAEARQLFVERIEKTVFETGLVISKENPWIGVSPNGVVFENGRPTELLEIKCPYKGASMSVDESIEHEFKKCLKKRDGNYYLKKKHKYYDQVQLGMAVLNVLTTSFVIYASYDKSMKILSVPIDEPFILKMLTALKPICFNVMLHCICLNDDSDKENVVVSEIVQC